MSAIRYPVARSEAAQRGIYGEATPDEAETLREEGIQVSRIPGVPARTAAALTARLPHRLTA